MISLIGPKVLLNVEYHTGFWKIASFTQMLKYIKNHLSCQYFNMPDDVG